MLHGLKSSGQGPGPRGLNPFLALLLLALVGAGRGWAQSPLAHEPFAAAPGTFLHGLAGGTGFVAPWAVIGFDGNVSQFRVANASPLAFGSLSTSGNYLVGGYNNFTSSRRLDVTGTFPNHLVVGSNPAVIGRDGTTLWVSALLRREVNDATQMALSLVNADDIADLNNIRVGVGYYGASSDNAGQRFWTLLVNNPGVDNFTFVRSAIPITNGVPVLAVLRIQFGPTDQMDLFINPALGGAAPVTPAATRSSAGGANILLRTLGFWSSANNSNATIDEIRLGASFLSVTPTNPPVAAPGSVQFSAAGFAVTEDGGPAIVSVTRLGGTGGAVSVDYATSNGTATAGSDYTAAGGTLHWADGDASNKTFAVTIANDALVESSETVSLILSNPTGGATLGALSNGALTIADDDGLTSLVISNHSFELPAIGAGTFSTTAVPPGWSAYGNGLNFANRTVGVLRPVTTTLYLEPVPDGQNVGVIFLMDNQANQTFFAGIEAGMQQTLADLLQPRRQYVLRVEVGNINNDANAPFAFAGFPNYRIDLLAGTNVLASDLNTLLPAEGRFLTSTVAVAIAASHPFAGQPLGVRLVNLNSAPGIEVNWDNVRLTAGPWPSLNVRPAGNSVQLAWPATAPGFTLQSATNLALPVNWQPAGVAVIQTNGEFRASVPGPTAGERYFRLQAP